MLSVWISSIYLKKIDVISEKRETAICKWDQSAVFEKNGFGKVKTQFFIMFTPSSDRNVKFWRYTEPELFTRMTWDFFLYERVYAAVLSLKVSWFQVKWFGSHLVCKKHQIFKKNIDFRCFDQDSSSSIQSHF